MTLYSFLQGYNDQLDRISKRKDEAINRQNTLATMEYDRQERPLNLEAKRLRNALDKLNVQYEQDTTPLRISEFKRKMEDSIREYDLRRDLDPKVRQLAALKADADITTMQNSMESAQLDRAVTPEQFNDLLTKQGKPYRVKAVDDGLFALVDSQGKQLGDAVPLEQLAYSLQSPQPYNKDAYGNLAAQALATAKSEPSYTVNPPATGTGTATTGKPTGGTLNIPSILGGTPTAQLLAGSPVQQPANAQNPATATTPPAQTIQAARDMYTQMYGNPQPVRTTRDIYRAYNQPRAPQTVQLDTGMLRGNR